MTGIKPTIAAEAEKERLAPAFLIINADDYGYFASVSRGIIDGARDGLITATGIMANGPCFEERVDWLGNVAELDAGVHLNITYGRPLTARMKAMMHRWNGDFPGKFQMTLAILRRQIGVADVLGEWRAQIERCLAAGIDVKFLNSHEHLHMFPPLYAGVRDLAGEYGIPYVRHTRPELDRTLAPGPVLRYILLGLLERIDRRRAQPGVPQFMGFGQSGKLGVEYTQRCLSNLQAGKVYELMCHPGYFDPQEIDDPKLLAYHRWEDELALLRSAELRELCRSAGVEVIGYRDLPPMGNRSTNHVVEA